MTQEAPIGTDPSTTVEADRPTAVPHHDDPPSGNGQAQSEGGCTQAQLRRFIKSRPYVPMHELRRRFELNGQPDDVTPISSADGVIYVGLPSRESVFVAELLRQGDIGVELCRDPAVPIVVGVFAIRPVTR